MLGDLLGGLLVASGRRGLDLGDRGGDTCPRNAASSATETRKVSKRGEKKKLGTYRGGSGISSATMRILEGDRGWGAEKLGRPLLFPVEGDCLALGGAFILGVVMRVWAGLGLGLLELLELELAIVDWEGWLAWGGGMSWRGAFLTRLKGSDEY